MATPSPRNESPYRTPTRPLDVRISIEGGRTEEVTLYLALVSETHAGAETLDEALNRDRDFIPVRSKESGETYLVRRGALRSVTVGDGEPDVLPHEESPVCVDLVRLELEGGESLEGTLATVLPPDKPRLSDYFNTRESMFVPLAVEEGVTFVNRDYISVVWL